MGEVKPCTDRREKLDPDEPSQLRIGSQQENHTPTITYLADGLRSSKALNKWLTIQTFFLLFGQRRIAEGRDAKEKRGHTVVLESEPVHERSAFSEDDDGAEICCFFSYDDVLIMLQRDGVRRNVSLEGLTLHGFSSWATSTKHSTPRT